MRGEQPESTVTPAATPPAPGRLRAAWTLVVLTTLCAELTFTAVAVPLTWLLLPLLMVMYGAGVLVVREAVVRVGGAWPSLVLLGLAYQLAEDGLGLQALTSPEMYGAAEWGWRASGVNWTYWESQIGVHVVFSVLIPVLLTDLLFPALRGRPYVRTGGLAGVAALAAVGVVGLRVVISATEHPGYRTPWGWTLGYLVAIAVLAWSALRIMPRHNVTGPRPARSTPRPEFAGAVAAVVTLLFLGALLPPGLGPDSLFGDRVPPVIPLVFGAAVALAFAWAVLRWAGTSRWSDRHRIWLVGGILIGHTVFMMPASLGTAVAGAVTVVAEIAAPALLARRVRRRASTDSHHRSERADEVPTAHTGISHE